MSDDGGPIAFNDNGDGEGHTPGRRRNANPFNKRLEFPGYKEKTYPEPLGPWVDELTHYRTWVPVWVGLRNWPRFQRLMRAAAFLQVHDPAKAFGQYPNLGGAVEQIFLMMCLQWRYRNNINALKVRDSLIPGSLTDMRSQIDTLANINSVPGIPECGSGAYRHLVTSFHWMRWNILYGHPMFRDLDGYYTGYDQNPTAWRKSHEKTIFFESQAGMAVSHSPYAYLNTAILAPAQRDSYGLTDENIRKILWAKAIWTPTTVLTNYKPGKMKKGLMPTVPTTQEILRAAGLLSPGSAGSGVSGTAFETYNLVFSSNPLSPNYPKNNPFDVGRKPVS
jgi:hypothetical protein